VWRRSGASSLIAEVLFLGFSTAVVLTKAPSTAATIAVTPQIASPRGVDDPRKVAKKPKRSHERCLGPKRPADASGGTPAAAEQTWSTIFRLYGALPPWFDDTWKPNVIRPGTPTRAPPAPEGATA
jgi:hypothetical protein